MTTFVLDLNDGELRIARIAADSVEVVAQSTGFALISDRVVLLGDGAIQQFRLQPRQASNQFWNRLSTDPLPVRGPDTANFADLVFRHLSELVAVAGLGKSDELFIAVPGTTTPEQLGLLVGIAAETGVNTTGLVDSAVAASSLYPATTSMQYMDVFLHRAVLTELSTENGVTRQRVLDFAELGLGGLMEAWINVIADRFIRDTRFDPLGIASTDQQLYNQLRAWLQQSTLTPDVTMEFEHHGTLRRAELTSEALIAKVIPRYRTLEKQAREATLLLSHRAARLPGLSDHLSGSGISVAVVDPLDVFRGIAAHEQSIRSDPQALRLVTRLPRLSLAREIPARPAPQTRHVAGAPTHIVFDGDALAIGSGIVLDAEAFTELPAQFPSGRIEIVNANDSIALRLKDGTQATLNGETARNGAVIDKGSTLEIGGTVFRFVRIRNAR
jgi:hypothetical protein